MINPPRLSVIASVLAGSGLLALGLLPATGHAEATATRLYTVESRTSLYQLTLVSHRASHRRRVSQRPARTGHG